MKSLAREDAEATVTFLKAQAVLLDKSAESVTPKNRRIRCTYAPDRSYGRLHEPPEGNKEFQWFWEWWSEENNSADWGKSHIALGSIGYRGLAHEGEALALLMGEDPSLDAGRELAERFR